MTRFMKLAWVCVFALTIALAASACPDKGTRAGDRCVTSADCRAPLVCSNRFAEAGVMGVCVHPEALTDATVPDAGDEPDGETEDASQQR
jgi:hypothetical protein